MMYVGSLVVGGKEVNQPKGHYTKDYRPKGFDVDRIFVLANTLEESVC